MLDVGELTPRHNVVVTNPFGIVDNIDDIRSVAGRVICDSGSAFDALRCHDVDEAFSLHHTKPWGFGEGGCIIVKTKHERLIRAILNFGLPVGSPADIKKYASNYKMSDISAAFILQRLDEIEAIREQHHEQYGRVLKLATKLGYWPLIDHSGRHVPFCAPLVHPQEVTLREWSSLKLHKYYSPLLPTTSATWLYRHILCCPCHRGVSAIPDDQLVRVLEDSFKFSPVGGRY